MGENSPVTTLALSCSVLNENSPIKTHQLLYWSGEKNLYQCDTFHNEIRPRENNLFVIPSGQTKKIIRMLDKTTYKDLFRAIHNLVKIRLPKKFSAL